MRPVPTDDWPCSSRSSVSPSLSPFARSLRLYKENASARWEDEHRQNYPSGYPFFTIVVMGTLHGDRAGPCLPVSFGQTCGRPYWQSSHFAPSAKFGLSVYVETLRRLPSFSPIDCTLWRRRTVRRHALN